MKRYRIEAENGNLKRVTIEHGLLDPRPISDLAARLMDVVPDFHRKDTADLHLTLFHFGLPHELYLAVTQLLPALSFESFLGDFLNMLAACEGIVSRPVPATTIGLAKFGSKREPTLVAQVEATGLAEAHHHLELSFLGFLRGLGMDEAQLVEFMASTYWRFQLDNHFKPHISLGRMHEDLKLPPVNASGIRLELTPSRIRNVKVMEEGRWVWSH